MTTINDISDFARILREQPEWADTIRSILLSRELLELPQRLAEYIATTDRRLEALEAGQARLETALAEFMASTNRRLEALEAGQARLEAGQARLEAGQTQLEAGQTQLEDRQAQLEDRQARLEAGQARLEAGHDELRAGQDELRIDVAEIRRDVAEIRESLRPLKASHARNGAERETRRIARLMNCRQVALLNDDDLYDMMYSNPAAADISRSDRDSFERADIVILAERRDTGETRYIAVEASFTAHEDDTRRAIRNAEYLARFTGQPSHAVVASCYVDPDVEPIFADGRVHWVEIDRKYMETY